MKLRIATRRSPLALWQANFIRDALQRLQPNLEVTLVERVTRGDKILDQALSKVGGKDLFVKEIENALIDGEAEVAVHSLKDMPTDLPEGLVITAFPKREDPRDALVSEKGHTLKTLPENAIVGTSSLRRAAQILSQRPDLKIVPIRGNVQTRLQRMREQGMDATLLAVAGLVRSGLESRISEVLDPALCLPAVGQGILAVQTREADSVTNALVTQLDDSAARACALCERSFLHRLQGGCQVPIAGHAAITGDGIVFDGLVSSLDGRQVLRTHQQGSVDAAAAIGIGAAETLLEQGAQEILEALKTG